MADLLVSPAFYWLLESLWGGMGQTSEESTADGMEEQPAALSRYQEAVFAACQSSFDEEFQEWLSDLARQQNQFASEGEPVPLASQPSADDLKQLSERLAARLALDLALFSEIDEGVADLLGLWIQARASGAFDAMAAVLAANLASGPPGASGASPDAAPTADTSGSVAQDAASADPQSPSPDGSSGGWDGAGGSPAPVSEEGAGSAAAEDASGSSGGGGGMALLGGDNQNPIAADDTRTTNEDTPITINVLENDSDPDGNHIFITGVTQPLGGTVTFTATTVTYTPTKDYYTTAYSDHFTYTITDGHFNAAGEIGTATATVSVSVTAVDDLPVAVADFAWVSQTGSVDIPVLANDYDGAWEGPLAVTSVPYLPMHDVAINPDGTVHYYGGLHYPPYYFPGQVGWSYLNYQITDSTAHTATGSISIYTSSDTANDSPFALRDDVVMDEDDPPLVIYPLGNDWDPDGSSTFSLYSATAVPPHTHGTLEANLGAGTVTYTPTPDYSGSPGTNFFYYTVRDNFGLTSSAYVWVDVRPVNDKPVAADDHFYTGKDYTVTLYPKWNDTDVDDTVRIISEVADPVHGSVWFTEDEIHYTPDPDFTSGDDIFTYTLTDGHGGTDTATITVTMVEVPDFLVEWKDPDDAWVDVSAEWQYGSQDDLRWLPVFSDVDPPTLTRVDWLEKPWEYRDDPSVPWEMFTTASGDNWAYGIPAVGEWAVTPKGYLTHAHQTAFCAVMAAPKRKVPSRIDSVQLVTHEANPSEAAELVADEWGNLRMFPDAAAPGQAARPKVDVVVTVSPRLPNLTVKMASEDVDDPSSTVAPIDADRPANEADDADNRPNDGCALDHLPAEATTDASGRVRAEFYVGRMQPGNNYRIVAAIRREHLNRAWSKTQDTSGRMFYDKGRDKVQGPYDPTMDETTYVKDIRLSRMLTVWRKLHVEVDSMGAVTGNVVSNVSGLVQDLGGGTSRVPLSTALPAEDNNRFENGTLRDAAGNTFQVVSNTTTEVIVNNLPGPILPGSNVSIELRDDDFLNFQEGQDVPMPDTSQLASAMAEAYVKVLFDVGDNNTNVPFMLNVRNSEIVTAQDWDTVGDNSEAYWVAYVLGAFQGEPLKDDDPNSEDPTVWFGATDVSAFQNHP